MSVVILILFGTKADKSWGACKKRLLDASFLKKMQNYDKDNISDAKLRAMEKYTHR